MSESRKKRDYGLFWNFFYRHSSNPVVLVIYYVFYFLPGVLLSLLLREENRSGFIDRSGHFVFRNDKIVVPSRFSESLYRCVDNESAEFLDICGEKAFPETYRWALDFSEGLAAVLDEDKWGFIDLNGQLVIDRKFEDVESFSGGLAAVKYNGNWGFINRAGDWIATPEFENAISFSEGLAAVSANNRIGFIDKQGRMVIEPKYDEVAKFSEGLARVVSYEADSLVHRVKYIDPKGETVIDLDERFADSEFNYEKPRGRGVHSYYLNSNEILESGRSESRHRLSSRYKFVSPFVFALSFHEGFARVQLDGKYGFIDRSGNLAIAPIFFHASEFSEGLAVASTEPYIDGADRNYGFIDSSGNFALPPIYWVAKSFREGLASVELTFGRIEYIDRSGKVVVSMRDIGNAGDFCEGLAPIERFGLFM